MSAVNGPPSAAVQNKRLIVDFPCLQLLTSATVMMYMVVCACCANMHRPTARASAWPGAMTHAAIQPTVYVLAVEDGKTICPVDLRRLE